MCIRDREKAEQLIGAIKGEVVSSGVSSPEEIREIVDQAVKEMEVKLSEEDRQAIVKLMEKIENLDLDINSLKEQAKNLYDKIEDLGLKLDINQEEVKGCLLYTSYRVCCLHWHVLSLIYLCFVCWEQMQILWQPQENI